MDLKLKLNLRFLDKEEERIGGLIGKLTIGWLPASFGYPEPNQIRV
jgi:hypothetical protein